MCLEPLRELELLGQLTRRLLPWYEAGHRDLPWRKDREPYHIWLSEIMLQQTRVEAVKGYYTRFLRELPTIEALAGADDDRLKKLWEGLGYYTRVRNLKQAAVRIMEQHGGVFPRDYGAVRALPGIGDYTAGAICSIAFGLPTPAVDGNVLRVLSRLLCWQEPIDKPQVKKQATSLLEQVYPRVNPGDMTQALMELGATVCGPNGAPDCGHCPMGDVCMAHQLGTETSYPRRLPKRARKEENRTVLVLSCQGRFALEKRENKGLLAGLWQFPNVPGHLTEQQALDWAASRGLGPGELRLRVRREHIFTHIRWNLWAYRLDCREAPPDFVWMTPRELERDAALPTAFRQFMDLTDL